MAFFDDLKKNAKTAADATKKKTNELTAIAKATMAVKSEENKMTELYKEIGRLFYEAERDGTDNAEVIAEYIMQIDKSKAKVASLKKKIASLKKVIVCESCGNEISNTCNFCPICGTKTPAKEECCCEEKAEECCCEESTEECCCCEEKAEECCCEENSEECCCCEEKAEECCCEENTEECCCEEDKAE
ncbi:MAG: hypothetical protein E7658_00765 [Ruminococcaceae bacterium]|nr:hypothetical protein [Oscillospiraceae bacterium]